MSASKHTVAIIGGGFCGVMTAVHLLRTSQKELSILLFEAANEVGRGVAYSSYTSGHLLNVPARNMSAFPDQPGDFVDWLSQQTDYLNSTKEEIGQFFVPRILFGNYIKEIFNREISKHVGSIQIVAQRVTACRKTNDDYLVQTAAGHTYAANKVVIATGNFLPGKPKGIPHNFTNSNRYFKNPWDASSVNVPDEKLPVLIAGTGLTMVDVVIALIEKRPQQKIIAISPKGYEILSHKHYGSQPAILEELHPPYQLDQLVKIFRRHIQAVWKRGITGEAVVDAVRSRTQEIWRALSMEEKKRFLSHLRHLWGLARHRLPAGIHSLIRQLRERGQLNIIAGRILDAHEDSSSVIVTYLERKTTTVKEIRVSRIINCTGPQTDVIRLNDPLFKQLYEDGIITPDSLGMGIRCDEYCRPIDKNGSSSPNLFAMGSLLKGDRWESTAVPELRVQATQIADMLAK